MAAATRASLLIRLALLADDEGADSRYGLGYGVVTVFDEARAPVSQDGPGWWSAREAIERAKRIAGSSRTSFVRTCFATEPTTLHEFQPGLAAVEPFLFCRDAIVERVNARQQRLLLGLMFGHSQTQIASLEGVTQGAVSLRGGTGSGPRDAGACLSERLAGARCRTPGRGHPASGAGLADIGQFLLGCGAALFVLATSNRTVRLVLQAAGTPAPKGETTLSGGRILGPMERLFWLIIIPQISSALMLCSGSLSCR